MFVINPKADVVRNRGSLNHGELAALLLHDARAERGHDHLRIPALHHIERRRAGEQWIDVTRRTVLGKQKRTIGLWRARRWETEDQESDDGNTVLPDHASLSA